MRAEFVVPGEAAPQGSKTARVGRNGRAYVVESSARVKPWRESVAWHAARTGVTFGRGVPVAMSVVFERRRPKSHYGSGRNADRLRPAAPPHPSSIPDLDKLLRALFDALTASGIVHDDAQIVRVYAQKSWAPAAARTVVAINEIDTTQGNEEL